MRIISELHILPLNCCCLSLACLRNCAFLHHAPLARSVTRTRLFGRNVHTLAERTCCIISGYTVGGEGGKYGVISSVSSCNCHSLVNKVALMVNIYEVAMRTECLNVQIQFKWRTNTSKRRDMLGTSECVCESCPGTVSLWIFSPWVLVSTIAACPKMTVATRVAASIGRFATQPDA
jgi:hypothetical protein